MNKFFNSLVGAIVALTIVLGLALPVGTPAAQAKVEPPPGGYPVYDRVREFAWWTGDKVFAPCMSAVDLDGVRFHCLGYLTLIDWDVTLPDARAFCKINGVDYRGAGVKLPRSESFTCNFDDGTPVPASTLPGWQQRPLPSLPSQPTATPVPPAPPSGGPTQFCDPARPRLHRSDSPFLAEVRSGIIPTIQDDEAFILCESYTTSDGVRHSRENEFGLHFLGRTARPVTPRSGITFQFGSADCSAAPCDGSRIGPFVSDGVVMRWTRAPSTNGPPVAATPVPGQTPFPGQPCDEGAMWAEFVNSTFDPVTGQRGVGTSTRLSRVWDSPWCSLKYDMGLTVDIAYAGPGVRVTNSITGQTVDSPTPARYVTSGIIRYVGRLPNATILPPPPGVVATPTPIGQPTATPVTPIIIIINPTPTPTCPYCNVGGG